MGNFRECKLSKSYRVGSHNLGRDFFLPLLENAAEYKRAVGFFSSSIFSFTFDHFLDFFERGGVFRLVCSPRLSREDIDALGNAIVNRPGIKIGRSIDILRKAKLSKDFNYADFLSWAVASDYIKIKIAQFNNSPVNYMYHEKIGCMVDEHNNIVSFSGSANETYNAYFMNFERIDVFDNFSSEESRIRARGIENNFNSLWRNDIYGLSVIELQEAIIKDLLIVNKLTSSYVEKIVVEQHPLKSFFKEPELLMPPYDLKLMLHQEAAIKAWAKAGGRGILEMATGSGKTITALSIVSRVYDQINSGLCVLIVAPLIHLVDQWRREAHKFGLDPTRCAEGKKRWIDELNSAIAALNSGHRKILSIATTGATLGKIEFQDLINKVKKPLIIIADEVHNYGGEVSVNSLPERAALRVGLSATYDEDNMPGLADYFGKTVYTYGLSDALKDGVLTPYRYYPIAVTLESDELEEYLELTACLPKYLHDSDKGGELTRAAQAILLKRARLIGSAKNKIPLLKAELVKRASETHILVYCGDGTVEGPDDEGMVRQIEEVVRMIGKELGMLCASYTAKTPPNKRQQLLEDFAAGKIQVLVAIRCLDEGVDVPSTRTAFILASSANPRQSIQRRGRVLRKALGKAKADIYDFFVTPSIDEVQSYAPEYATMRKLISKELKRALEFAELAENGPVAIKSLEKIIDHFHLIV